MKMFLWSLCSLVVILVLFIAWASYPWSINESVVRSDIIQVETEDMVDTEDHPSVVKVLTFNLGFLYGKGSEGPGYEHRERAYFEDALTKLATEIKNWDVDILLFQEIDFDSSRSGYIDQAQFVARKAGFPYVAEAVSWDLNYIPYPYYPLKNHFGSMKSGGAILSKYPLSDHEVTLLKKPSSQPWWYNLFYLHRYFQKVTVTIGDKKFNIVNLHLEAFDKDDRMKQAEYLVKKVKEENLSLIGGDFNMLPQSATNTSKFYNDDNYDNDKTYSIMMTSGLLEVIPDEIYVKDETRYFTFPAWKPDRRLDYIWYEQGLKMMKAEVLSSALSDHLPLRATFQIDGPRFNPYSQ